MKTKAVLLLCLFAGIGLPQVAAQPVNKSGTGSEVSYYQDVNWWTPVFCDGVLIDMIEGSGNAQFIDHFADGVDKWEILNYSGTGKSDWTGESFTFSEQDKTFFSHQADTWWTTVKTHIKGDKGALYNISFFWIWDGSRWVLNLKDATCTGNNK